LTKAKGAPPVRGERRERGRPDGGGGRRPAGGGPGWADRAVRAVVTAVVGFGLRVGLGLGLVLAVATFLMWRSLPPASELFDGRARGSVTLLDRNDRPFAWRGEQFGGDIRMADVSPLLIDAILAAEDRRFFGHFGVDPIGLTRALVANVRAGRVEQGGSTLTQQVAKNVFLTGERSLDRKLKEIPMALAMELKYTKEEILSVYLNRVYLGAGAYGFEAASRRYFDKPASAVTVAEAAMLAGLLTAPSRLAPTADLARAQARAAVVIGAMESEGKLSPLDAAVARANPAQLSQAAAGRVGGQFADWVMDEGPDYLTEGTTEDVTIRTTFDPAAQRAAEEGLAEIFSRKLKADSGAQAAVVVMSADGEVRAVVGGRDGRAGGFNRATQARRQTGSAFKTFVYLAALERGMSPADPVLDAPITIRNWSPENYGGGYAGTVTLADAFARSLNTPAVRVSETVGRERVRAVARKLGVGSPLAEGPALALGVSEATLLEMTGAYAPIANGGFAARPWGIREITARDGAGTLMEGGAGARPRVLDHRVAGRMTAMLADVVRTGTGRRADLGAHPAAGKTGTTQAARDAWFVGFTAHWVVGVWMGYDDNRPLSGVTGGGLPAEIWRAVMLRLHEGLPPKPLPELRDAPARPAPGPAVASAPATPRAQPAAAPAADRPGFFGRLWNDVTDALAAGEESRDRLRAPD
jgi:1A family penicillin-binding protein